MQHFFNLIFLYVCVLPVCIVCTPCVSCVFKGQKIVSDPLELEVNRL